MAQVKTPQPKSDGARRRSRRQRSAWSDATSKLRRAYFAHAGELAMRYGVTFDRVAQHVHRGWTREPALTVKSIRYAEDLVHAVACVDNVGLAWSDVADHHERMLIRACRDRLDETDAILVVRRLFVHLRRTSTDGPETRGMSLRGYLGTCSLRGWLCRCLAEAMNDAVAAPSNRPVKPMRFCEHKSPPPSRHPLGPRTAGPATTVAPARRGLPRAIDYGPPDRRPAAGGDEIG
ncbi:MAG: hypothetical protein V3T53_07680 [Phycisphaerales bacterium]